MPEAEMAHRFVHVGFSFAGVTKMRDLEPAFTAIGDWVRYSELNWLIWTEYSLDYIYGYLKPHVGPNDQVLISEIYARSFAGFLPTWIWGWINSKPTGSPMINVVGDNPLASLLDAYKKP
jgi:hypothetical protein